MSGGEQFQGFRVASLVLPTDHHWWESDNERVTLIIDTNRNGVADGADLAETESGGLVWMDLKGSLTTYSEVIPVALSHEYFTQPHPRVAYLSETQRSARVAWEELRNAPKNYANVADDGVERMLETFVDHPVATVVGVRAAQLASLHPIGRGAVVLLVAGSSVYGAADFTADKIDGVMNGTPMGENDVPNLLMGVGGAKAFESTVQVTNALASRVATVARQWWSSGGGGMGGFSWAATGGYGEMCLGSPALEGAGVNVATGSLDAGPFGPLAVFNVGAAGAEPRILEFRTPAMTWEDRTFSYYAESDDFKNAYELFCRWKGLDPETAVAKRQFIERLLRLGVVLDEDGTANMVEAFNAVSERTLTFRQLMEVDMRMWANQDNPRFEQAFDRFVAATANGRQQDVAVEEWFLLQLEKMGVRFSSDDGRLVSESLEPALAHVERSLSIFRHHAVHEERTAKIKFYHVLRNALETLLGREPALAEPLF